MDRRVDIAFVGVLQDLGMPYVMLYIGRETRSLYVLVRVGGTTADNSGYVAAEVSPDDILDYMSEKTGLVSLFNERDCFEVRFIGDRAVFHPCLFGGPNDKMERNDYFDPDLCDDEIWVETVLDRIKDNKPLETA